MRKEKIMIILTILAISSGFAFIAVLAAAIRSSEIDQCQPNAEMYEANLPGQRDQNFSPRTYRVV
jgi:hypothetical protein